MDALEASSIEQWLSTCEHDLAWVLQNPDDNVSGRRAWRADPALRTLSMMSSQPLAALKFLGMRAAIEHGDVETMGRAVQQYRRLQAVALANTGYDHCDRYKIVLEALAVGDLDNVRRLLPEGIGFSTNGHRFCRAVTNLVLPLVHRSGYDASVATGEGRRFLEYKNSKTEDALVRALLAVHGGDATALSEQLALFIAAYRTAGWAHNLYSSIGKFSATYAYGLVVLARLRHGPALADAIEPPDNPIWDTTFVTRVASGKPFAPYVTFEGTLASWNDPMQWPASLLRR